MTGPIQKTDRQHQISIDGRVLQIERDGRTRQIGVVIGNGVYQITPDDRYIRIGFVKDKIAFKDVSEGPPQFLGYVEKYKKSA